MGTTHGTSGNDSLSNGGGDDSIYGGLGNDTITDSGGTDTIYGGDGNDRLNGGDGDRDSLFGGTGNDTITSGGGDRDSAWGDTGGDSITMSDGANLIYGGADGDTILALGGNDTVFAGSENDLVFAGWGHDSVSLGDGDDSFGTWSVDDSGNDTVQGGLGHDQIIGGGGNDQVFGEEGNDQLSGQHGSDSLYGGDGNDRFTITDDHDYDSLSGGSGADGIEFSNYLSSQGVIVTYTGAGAGSYDFVGTSGAGDFSGIEGLALTGFDDTLYGGADSAGMMVYAGAGNDSLIGGSGQNLLYAGDGRDTLSGGAGNDLLDGGAGHDLLVGGAGHDTLAGGAGHDTFDGGSGQDNLNYSTSSGGVTVNLVTGTLTGGDATGDVIWGGIDGVIGSAFADSLTGGDGQGTTGDIYTSQLYGQGGNDTLGGNGGDDLLFGGADNDLIYGGTGHDLLEGGAGADTVTGGTGNDSFVLQDLGGADRITDFDLGDADNDGFTNDQLDVEGLQNAQGDPVRSYDVAIGNDGFGNAVLQFPGGESVVLQGISPATAAQPGQLYAMGVPCFAAGMRIATPRGERPVEEIAVGDLVLTWAGQAVPVLWHGRRALGPADLEARPDLRPIRIEAGRWGARRALTLSPQHGVVMDGPAGPRLVRARHLAEAGWGARVARGVRRVTYHHLLLPQHAVILAEGCLTESFYPGPMAVAALAPADRRALLAAILGDAPRFAPDLTAAYGPRCLKLLSRSEVSGLRVAAG